MTDWKIKASEYFPELRAIVEAEPSPLSLWIKLRDQLARMYRQRPLDDLQIGKIYSYAAWCFMQPSTANIETDPSNGVAVAFIENIPLDKDISSDLHRWMSLESFADCEPLFRQTLNDEEFKAFSARFYKQKESFNGSSRF